VDLLAPPQPVSPVAVGAHSAVACALRRPGPGTQANSGSRIGRPVARSTMIGSASTPVCASMMVFTLAPSGAKWRLRRRATRSGPTEVHVHAGPAGIHPAADGRCKRWRSNNPASTSALSRRASILGAMAEAVLEFIEARQPEQGIAHDQHTPPLADPLKAAGNRARHVAESSCAAAVTVWMLLSL